MSSPTGQQALFRYNNQGLFSNHYLDERLPEHRQWKEYDTQFIEEIIEPLRQLWSDLEPDQMKESQIERNWIRPVLDMLGHIYEVQVSLQTPRSSHPSEPDYIFVSRDEQLNKLKGTVSDDDLSDALAVGDAKRWDRNLDAKQINSRSLSDVPAQQIDFYLRYTGLDWGILTNGRQWRLYHTDSSHKFDVFYEIDLPELLNSGNHAAFKYFYLFFHRSAFEGTPSFLDQILEQSRAYQHGIGEDLKAQVYEALLSLSRGFLSVKANGLSSDQDTLETIHDNSLIVLYRILFLLFSESRNLLPVNDSGYEFYSIAKLKRQIEERGPSRMGVVDGTSCWGKLQNLWRFVDRGDDSINIPAYNGGLFDPEKHPFLETHTVGDIHLARAIDLLARAADPQTGRREFVDYRDLDVRHLGSIYEGLLEYKLRCADEPLKVDSSGTYTKADDPSEADIDAGELYLVTDKGERKATGSYYTPHYIVEYIVDRTVGPILDELREEHTNGEGEFVDRQQLVTKVLDINVLDPAMGSGHFLVEVTDYIARFLVEVAPPTDDNDSAETELAYWRRRTAQACIYGVDVNPLAVELAKLSLWLRTVAEDKPLSFLDHHLRCGNSLVGARVDELPLAPEQTRHFREKEQRQPNLLDTDAFQDAMESARDLMDDIEAIAGETLDEVREAADLYEQLVEEYTKRPRLLADGVTAFAFDLDVDADYFDEFLPRLRNGTWESAPEYVSLVDAIASLAERQRFFHWELEFPEVFFDRNGELANDDAGFDAVIGNPPYVDSEQMVQTSPRLREYVAKTFDTASGNWDLYIPFWELSIQLLNADRGRAGMITPSKWIAINYGKQLRQISGQRITHLADFSRVEVFGDASIFPVVTCMKKTADDPVIDVEVFDDNRELIFGQDVDRILLNDDSRWGVLLTPSLPVLETIWDNSTELQTVADAEEPATVAEAYEMEDVLHEQDELDLDTPHFKFVVTGTIDPYESLWGVHQTRYLGQSYLRPVIVDSQFRRQFERRWEQAGSQKLCISGIRHFEAFWDPDGTYVAGKSTVIVRNFSPWDGEVLLGLFNSRLMTFYINELYGSLAMDAGINFTAPLVRQLPLPDVSFQSTDEPAEQEAALLRSTLVDRPAHEVNLGALPREVLGRTCGLFASHMAKLIRKRQDVRRGLNPFNWLDRGVDMTTFGDAFSDELQDRAELVLGDFNHDVDGLALERRHDDWLVRVQLKKRDPHTDWNDWIKDGNRIARQWVTAYRIPIDGIDEKKAVYYQQAFEVIDDFRHFTSFPTARTRSTQRDLMLSKVPEFDTYAAERLQGLVKRRRRLDELDREIAETDDVINQLVYELYGLTEEQIETVEGSTHG